MKKAALLEKWKKFYEKADKDNIDQFADKGGFDYESLCTGWCMAQGLTAEEAVRFYWDVCIPAGVY